MRGYSVSFSGTRIPSRVRGSADSTFSEGRRTTSNFNLEISVRLSKQLGCYTAIPNLLAELFKYNNSVAERQQTWRRKGNIDIAHCLTRKPPQHGPVARVILPSSLCHSLHHSGATNSAYPVSISRFAAEASSLDGQTRLFLLHSSLLFHSARTFIQLVRWAVHK